MRYLSGNMNYAVEYMSRIPRGGAKIWKSSTYRLYLLIGLDKVTQGAHTDNKRMGQG